MNRYRAYLDRIQAPAALHERLITGEPRPQRRPPAILRYGTIAACCAVGLLAGWALIRGLPGPGVQPVAAATPAVTAPPEATAPATPVPTAAADVPIATAADDPYLFLVEDPFEGQPHGNFNLPGVEIPELDPTAKAYGVDGAYSPSGGETITRLTPEEMIRAVGGEEEIPWTLGWAGFTLSGYGRFDETGTLWEATIHGINDAHMYFNLQLAPGEIPLADIVYPDAQPQDYAGTGVPVTVYCVQESEFYRYYAEFMCGDTGVRFLVSGSQDRERSAQMVRDLLATAIGLKTHPFTTEHLAVREEAVYFRGRTLTLEEAYAQALGQYFPQYLPGGFTATTGHWSESPMNAFTRLSATWDNGGYESITLWVVQAEEGMDTDAPILPAGEITPAALEEVGEYVDTDRGDVPGWRYHFTVEYPGSVWATYRIKGLSPQEAATTVNSCAYRMCSLPPAPTPAAE